MPGLQSGQSLAPGTLICIKYQVLIGGGFNELGLIPVNGDGCSITLPNSILKSRFIIWENKNLALQDIVWGPGLVTSNIYLNTLDGNPPGIAGEVNTASAQDIIDKTPEIIEANYLIEDSVLDTTMNNIQAYILSPGEKIDIQCLMQDTQGLVNLGSLSVNADGKTVTLPSNLDLEKVYTIFWFTGNTLGGAVFASDLLSHTLDLTTANGNPKCS